MADQPKDLNEALEQIERMKQELSKKEKSHRSDIDTLEGHCEAYEKKVIGLQRVIAEKDNRNDGPDHTEYEKILRVMKDELRGFHDRLTIAERKSYTGGTSGSDKKDEGLVYRKHTDAIRSLGRKPDSFERPSLTRTARDFMAEYIAYAQSIHSDNTYWFDGVVQFLKGEAKIFFDSYLTVKSKDDRNIEAFSEAFLTRFQRVSLEEMKKGASQRKQQSNESVRDYGVEMTRLMGRMNVDETFKLEFLITNMLPELQEPVLAAYPTTVEEALLEGERQEAVLRSIRGFRGAEKEADLIEQLRLKDAQLNAMDHKVKSRRVEFKDRSRKRERYSDNWKGKQNDHRSSSAEHRSSSYGSGQRSGSNSSRSGRDSSRSRSPEGRYNRHYSKDSYRNNKGKEKSQRYERSNSPSNQNSRSRYGSDSTKSHRRSDKKEGTLETLPSSNKKRGHLNE